MVRANFNMKKNWYCAIFHFNLMAILSPHLSKINGAPERGRTSDLQIRNLSLYPTELQARPLKDFHNNLTLKWGVPPLHSKTGWWYDPILHHSYYK
jgi:hypothetical protein